MAAKKGKKTKTVYRTAKKKVHRSAKPSAAGMVKGLLYGASLAAPGVIGYGQFKNRGDKPMQAIAHTLQAYGGMDSAGKFDMATVKQMYSPVAAVTVGDFVTTKLGVQKYPARALNKLVK